LIDYYRLKIGKEFKYPGFNGYMAKFKLLIGKDAFIDTPEKFK